MASLKKRNGTYYIKFVRTWDGNRKEKTYSLNTTIKNEALKLKLDYEDRFNRGEINPFGNWSPEVDKKKQLQNLERQNISLKLACDKFLTYRSVEMNETTRDNYRRHFNMLMDQLGQSMPINMITKDDIRDFCFKSHLKPATHKSYLRHIKVLFRWLRKEDYLKFDITEDIPSPKVPRDVSQKIVSKEEFDLIIHTYHNFNKEQQEKGFINQKKQLRLWFEPMVNTIYYCGLRVKEAVNLRWEDIDLNSKGYIRIVNTDTNTTKTGIERAIPIRKELYCILKEWHEQQGLPKTGYVFPRVTAKTNKFKMDKGYVSKAFKKFARLAGMKESIHLHGLRHSCATDLLRKGLKIQEVSKYLGHTSIQVTQIYEHLNESDLRTAIDRLEE